MIAVLSSHPAEQLREADWLVESIDQITVAVDDSATLRVRFPARVRSA